MSVEELNGYFHASNKNVTDWPNAHFARVVSLKQWVDALEKSQMHAAYVEQNPAVKLLDTLQAAGRRTRLRRHEQKSTARRCDRLRRSCPN
ncbi:hypothetical protein N7520_010215 [Penicillium odoratum]|uniref:uncharacterized protein n=1 Tax=Penicillium odoratum TaxID=1167516 RepID=UPI0025492052|nr:uncharacterized protein N7520_010215 [Penicillium odoratum]KAJ5753298.1 hypothetical protein N7520_010215 [Penicillium odoratum]